MTTSDTPLLSICVPTYNRAQKLDGFLKALLESVRGSAVPLEILISDNGSSDGTSRVVAAYRDLEPRIRYVRQERNLGAEGNFWYLWQAAAGKYVWIVGDDDSLESRAVTVVASQLQHSPDLLLLNYSTWDTSMAVCDNMAVYGGKDRRIENSRELMTSFGPDLAFISMAVIRRSILETVDAAEYSRLAPTGFAFMYGLYKSVAASNNIIFCADPIVRNRNAGTVPYNWDAYFVTGMAHVLHVLSAAGYEAASIAAARRRLVRRYIFPSFKQRKVNGGVGFRHFLLVAKAYGTTPNTWLMVLPLTLMPTSLIKTIEYLRVSRTRKVA